MERFISLFGIAIFIAIAVAFSTSRSRISWRTVLAGLALQLLLAGFIVKTDAGKRIFYSLNQAVQKFSSYSEPGATVVFGNLHQPNIPVGTPQDGADPKTAPLESDGKLYAAPNAVFAFRVIPILIFVSASLAILNYLGVVRVLVRIAAVVMTKTMKTSGAESACAAANVVFGQCEALLMVRGYLERMTRSELMTVMTAGMATIAGSVFAVYVAMLSDKLPEIGGHLLAASVIAAPAALIFAKIFVPETETPQTSSSVVLDADQSRPANLYAALTVGTRDGVMLSAMIVGSLIVFPGLMAMVDDGWNACCRTISSASGSDLSGIDSVPELCGYAFSPFAWAMGIPREDCVPAGALLGEKMFLNEFMAYTDFANHLNGQQLTMGADPHEFAPRSKVILAYALCGFANFGSIAILLASLRAIIPQRFDELARLGLRAMFAASLANLTTGAIAGLLI